MLITAKNTRTPYLCKTGFFLDEVVLLFKDNPLHFNRKHFLKNAQISNLIVTLLAANFSIRRGFPSIELCRLSNQKIVFEIKYRENNLKYPKVSWHSM